MPILKHENDIFPADLLENSTRPENNNRRWWSIYTLSRHEKELMRQLERKGIPFYGPMIPKRYRSPNGRLRTSYIPLFPNYVFMLGTEEERYQAMTTNCISRCHEVVDREQLLADLKQIYHVIGAGVPLTPESRLGPGEKVRVKSGPFAGYEGTVLRREGKTRFLLALHFLEQGVSMELDEGLLEPI